MIKTLLSSATDVKVESVNNDSLPIPVIVIIVVTVAAIIAALLVFYLKCKSSDEETPAGSTPDEEENNGGQNDYEDGGEEKEETPAGLDFEAELGAPNNPDELFFIDEEQFAVKKDSTSAAGIFKIPSGSSFTAKGKTYEYFGLSDRFPGKVLGIPAGDSASSSIEVLSMEDISSVENSATNYLAVRDSSNRVLEFTAKGNVSIFDGKNLRCLAVAKPYNGAVTFFSLPKGVVLRDGEKELGVYVAMDESEMVIKSGNGYTSLKLESVQVLNGPGLYVENVPSRNILIMLQDGSKLRVYDALTGQLMAK